MELVLLTIGLLVGVIIGRFLLKPKYAGVLLVYAVEEDEPPALFLDLDMSPDDIRDTTYVTFKVSRK